MDDDTRKELAALVRETRAHLLYESEAHGTFVELGRRPARGAAAPEPPSVQAPAPIAEEDVMAKISMKEKDKRLKVLSEEAAVCTRCRLHLGRTHSVFSRGSSSAELVFVGEGPGFNEDQQGLPFVGQAGQLLDKMITAMGYGRDDVYICNVVKCRPPENRTPMPDEAKACEPYLIGQLEVVRPKVIVALGKCAAENLDVAQPASKGWRGTWKEWRGVPVMPTYHPAFLLRSPQFKKTVWEDLQKVLTHLGRAPAARGDKA